MHLGAAFVVVAFAVTPLAVASPDKPDAGAERSLAPALLVATEQLVDPRFVRTVVLLVGTNPDGAYGVVLSRPTRVLGADVGRKLNFKVPGRAARTPVLEGGPVDPTQGIVLHGRSDVAERPAVLPGLWADDPEKVLEQLLREGELRARLFVGYAGWAPGQLENEIARGDWAVVPASARALFDVAPEALWETTRRMHGLRLEGSGVPARQTGTKPSKSRQ